MNIDDNETNRLVARQEIVDILEKTEVSNPEIIQKLDSLCSPLKKDYEDFAFKAKIAEYGKNFGADIIINLLYLIVTLPLFA